MMDQIAINISGAAKCLADMNFFDRVDFVKSCGVDAIELHPYKEWPEGTVPRGLSPPAPFAGVDDTEASRIRDCCAKLTAVSVHALMGQTFSSDDPVLRDEAIAGNRLAIRQAAFLGSKAVVIHCRMSRLGEQVVRDRIGSILLDLAEYGAAQGVRVCLETPTDLLDPTHFAAIFERVEHPNLGATIDTGHLLACLDEETKGSARVVAAYNDLLFALTRAVLDMGKLFHVHLNDIGADTLADHYGIGLGFIDFPRVLGEMKGFGYDGLLAMEIHRGRDGKVGSLSFDGFREATEYVMGIVG